MVKLLVRYKASIKKVETDIVNQLSTTKDKIGIEMLNYFIGCSKIDLRL